MGIPEDYNQEKSRETLEASYGVQRDKMVAKVVGSL